MAVICNCVRPQGAPPCHGCQQKLNEERALSGHPPCPFKEIMRLCPECGLPMSMHPTPTGPYYVPHPYYSPTTIRWGNDTNVPPLICGITTIV